MNFIFIALFLTFTNPCFENAVSFQSISHENESSILLSARRVQDIYETYFVYNLGKESILIYPKSFKAIRFIKNVKAGRCSERESVTIIPVRKSPFNTKFFAH